ncbi:MAG TPA: HEAT repeat domain-containing protein [Thermoanaerobaculia bacterium]|nr:HEAT repeat domain-containing protein [Thermoanaerobaculia bacterium]
MPDRPPLPVASLPDTRRQLATRRARACRVGVFLVAPFALAATSAAAARQVDLLAEMRSGDSTRCMEAGNVASEHRDQAAAVAGPLLDLIEQDHGCAGSAISALVNLGPGIAEGVDAARAVAVLSGVIERGIDQEYGEWASRASSAVSVLGHFGPEAAPALPLLERWIRERTDSFDQRYALSTIGDLGEAGAAAAPLLIELLGPSDDDSYERNELRAEAARTLAHLPAAAALAAEPLVAALSAEDWTLRSLASDALAAAGPGVVPAVLAELEADDDERREQAMRILSSLGESAREAAPVLADLLADPNWTVSYEAGELLEVLGPDERVIEKLAAMMHDSKNEDAVTRAAEILGGYGPAAAAALPALRHALTRGSWSVTDAAKTAIAKIEQTG